MNQLYFLLVFTLSLSIFARTPEEWRSRSIYQLLTDRFAKTEADTRPCRNLKDYCGGTFKGIMNNLDYIQGMGFDAIWMSPVVENTPGGYHGYWAKNLYEINPYFGTSDDLKDLVQACHKRDIWVMIDVAPNHMGPMEGPDHSDKFPFNKHEHYHENYDCSRINETNDTSFTKEHFQNYLEICWFYQLPDLDQENVYVRQELMKWISSLVRAYDFDGLRLDTVPYASKDYWVEFTAAAGVYTIGEAFNPNVTYDAGYQGPVSGMLNTPFFNVARSVFQSYGSMFEIQEYANNATVWPDLGLLGSFVDSHDVPRFLNHSSDHIALKSAIGLSLTVVGIPVVYYGSEQYFTGGNDPENRESIWPNLTTRTDMYDMIAEVNNFRKEVNLNQYDQVQRYADHSFYAFTRGPYLFAFTNRQTEQQRSVTFHPYIDGTILCNIFKKEDCLKVEEGRFTIILLMGEFKIYTPQDWGKKMEKITDVRFLKRRDFF